MAKIVKRPDPVQVGKFRATPVMTALESGGTVTVTDWRITDGDGKQVATLPAEQFASEGADMMRAWAHGQQYVPVVPVAGQELPRPLAWEKRRELLEQGRDHTLQVDAFTRSLAVSEADQDGMFRNALERHTAEQWPGLERELFASLYNGPEPLEAVDGADGWISKIHEQAAGLEQWEDLKRQCEGDPWAAGIGAGRVTEALGDALDKLLRNLPQQDPARQAEEAKELEELAPGAGAAQQQAAEAGTELAEAVAEQLEQCELEIRKAVRKAAEQAEGEIEEIRTALVGLGAGSGPGTLTTIQAPQEAIRKALRANPKLRRIAEIAGRMRLRARDKQRRKVEYLPEQVVDVTVGGELSRLLPSELALLALEETELLGIRKLIERQALEYELHGQEALDQGPVILAVDGSGSMEGARNEWAMGVALAILEVCTMQRRQFCLVHFDSTVQKTFVVPSSGRLTLDTLLEMVGFFSGGGTNFAPPLGWASGQIGTGTWSKSDVILVTDGGGSWGTAVAELNAKGAAVYGVAIESDFSAEQAKELSGVARVTNLAAQGGAQHGKAQDTAVDLVFGI